MYSCKGFPSTYDADSLRSLISKNVHLTYVHIIVCPLCTGFNVFNFMQGKCFTRMLKIQSCKLYNSKCSIASAKITKTEIFSLMAF